MAVYCCHHSVSVRKIRGRCGFPVWRGHCGRCGAWWCGEGHRTDLGAPTKWVDVYACYQGECAVFYDTWWKQLYRKLTVWEANDGMPVQRVVIPAEKRAMLEQWVKGRKTADARAVRAFLDAYPAPRASYLVGRWQRPT